MKKALSVLLFVAIFGFVNLIIVGNLYSENNLLQKLSMSEDKVHSNIFENITADHWFVSCAEAMKKITVGERVSVTGSICRYIKSYTKSEGFRDTYYKKRNETKPAPPEPLESIEDIRKRDLEGIEASIQEVKKEMASAPKDERDGLKSELESLQQQVKLRDGFFHGIRLTHTHQHIFLIVEPG